MPHIIRVPDRACWPRRMYRLLGVLLILGFLPPSVAAEGGDWRADAGNGELGFELSWEGEPLVGRFRRFEVEIGFDPLRPEAARFEVRIALDSTDLGNADLNQALAEPLWFDSGRFPEARFRGNAAQRLVDGRYRLRGSLRLKGRQRPVELIFAWTGDDTGARLKGEAELDRRAFGVGEGEWSVDPTVAFPVRVSFDLRLRAEDADGRD